MMKFLVPNTDQMLDCPSKDFEAFHHLKYSSHLEFSEAALEEKIKRQCANAHAKGKLDARQKWLGHYYASEIRSEYHLDGYIAWIDPAIGYGVFTNRPIRCNEYVGAYVGVIKKRPIFGGLKNNYCFDYTLCIGEKTPYIIDARDQGNYTRYINHSPHGNLETASVLCDEIMHIILYASCDIPKGAQLCYDYGSHYWERRKGPVILCR